MNRNTSFFWKSDDLRYHYDDSESDEGDEEQQQHDKDEKKDEERLFGFGGATTLGISSSSGSLGGRISPRISKSRSSSWSRNVGGGLPLHEEEEADEDLEAGGGGGALLSPKSSLAPLLTTTATTTTEDDEENGIALLLNRTKKHGAYGATTPQSAVTPKANAAPAEPKTTSGRRKLFHDPQIFRPKHKHNAPGASGTGMPAATINKSIQKSIRFQVVVWHIGGIDVQTGHVKMRFRLTLFWNDDDDIHSNANANESTTNEETETTTTTTTTTPTIPRNDSGDIWTMSGRQRAHLQSYAHGAHSAIKEAIDVPPVSILNAVEFETVDDGGPDVSMIDVDSRKMRWTCMYNATLFQELDRSVRDFPHDEHEITLKVGILAHRGKGGRWDKSIYHMGLAREEDSQGSTRVPQGLVVEHCHIPDFTFDPSDVRFEFKPLIYGGRKVFERERGDLHLQVTLPVYRNSTHYDTSIFPMLIVLNIIAISCLTRNFGSASAATEIMLSIAFVQVGIRLTLDSRLPSVRYQIKMQKVMNSCFWLLSGLVLESNVVFFLVMKRGWSVGDTDKIDLATACVALMYNIHITMTYFRGRGARRLLKLP